MRNKNKSRQGWTLILPDSDEPLVKIYSEGISEEYAEELSEFLHTRLILLKSRNRSIPWANLLGLAFFLWLLCFN